MTSLQINFLVCEWVEEANADFMSMFDDNVTAACCVCGHAIWHRPPPPYMSPLTPICRRCFMAKPKPDGFSVFVTDQNIRELGQFFRLNRTRQ